MNELIIPDILSYKLIKGKKKKKTLKYFKPFTVVLSPKLVSKTEFFTFWCFLLSKTGYFYQPHNPDARTG
jgi:hypothetical protein